MNIKESLEKKLELLERRLEVAEMTQEECLYLNDGSYEAYDEIIDDLEEQISFARDWLDKAYN